MASGSISQEVAARHSQLNIVGMVGSIDNDFCGTDMTIGTDSALHRILEVADAIIPTAHSHQRCFVLEVMGRHCGYLALVAGIVTEVRFFNLGIDILMNTQFSITTHQADFVFVPEWPPEEDWPDKLCRKLELERAAGQRLNIVIVSEGAIDRQGQPIAADTVKKVIVERLEIDTRVTVLGHVQRGGAPSAFDRILGCRMGAEAVMALVEAAPDTEPCVVTLVGNVAVRVPLMKCVEKTQAVTAAMAARDWERAIQVGNIFSLSIVIFIRQLRGRAFCNNLQTFRLLSRLRPPADIAPSGYRLAVVNIGSPCCGMNAAVRSFARNCINSGHTPLGVRDGVEGLAAGSVAELSWADVAGWVVQGGSLLGTKRAVPRGKFREIADTLAKFRIQGLALIGGFEAFETILMLSENRDKYPEFRIPMVVLPATISNNVPGEPAATCHVSRVICAQEPTSRSGRTRR